MGLLDDAIREHLDLKRRRGADPAEVERLEREALGPVRRGGFEPDEAVLAREYATGAEYSEEAEPGWMEPAEEPPLFEEAPEYEPPVRSDYEPSAEPPPYDEPPAEPPYRSEPTAESPYPADRAPEGPNPTERAPEPPRHHEIAEAWDAHESLHGGGTVERLPDEQRLAPEERPAAEHPLTPDERTERAGYVRPPAGHPGEETAEYDLEAAEESEEDEDVLEETPDFLQDTPDHDRLWFEQRPPRDFDFDG